MTQSSLPQTKANHQREVALSEILPIITSRPELVLDAFRDLWDDYDNTLDGLSLVPLGTPEGVAKASQLQGKAQALQLVIQTFLERIVEEAELLQKGTPNDNA